MRYYLDCEFDGHNGPLLSMALVLEDGLSLHLRTTARADDPWVQQHVEPHMDSHDADMDASNVPAAGVGSHLRRFIGDDESPVIIADSPVDIGRFCRAISTGEGGGWASADYPRMTFEVHNVDCYPTGLAGAVQHNAWWDAMALRHLLQGPAPVDVRLAGEVRRVNEPLPETPREAEYRAALEDFVNSVADALTWNSSASQCLHRVEQLVKEQRAALGAQQ